MKPIKKIRLKDIAEMTNVSVATVSIILKDPDTKRVSLEKRQEVLGIAEKYNYVPNAAARSLVKSLTNTIGLIIPDLENPFFASLAKKIEALARAKNYSILIVNADNDYVNDLELITLLYQRNVDAIILASSANSYGNEKEIIDYIQRIDIPVIITDRSLKGYEGSQIVFDNRYGIKIATMHCLEKGHTKIGFISAKNSSYNGYFRHLGYVDALEEAGIIYDDRLVQYGDFDFNTGYLAAPELINQKITALVASNDLIAYGFKRRAEECGVHVPNDISIIGFDNLSINNYISDGITSINLDVSAIAKDTLEAALKMIDDSKSIVRSVIKPVIYDRKSVIQRKKETYQ